MTTVAFTRRHDRPARQIVTGRLLGDPPADLAERRAEADRRRWAGDTLKTVVRELNPGSRRKSV